MKHITKTIVALLMLCCSFTANSQTEAEMKKWMDFSTPADPHKELAKMDGEWEEEITFWMDPSNPKVVQQMKATCVNAMILGGRYQETKHTGEFGGMPFEGISTVGYDNLLKKYVSTWVDNMGTGIMYMEGVWNAQTKTVTYTGKMTEAMEGKAVKVRQLFKIVDDNTQELTQYQEKKGKMVKTMYIKLTRKK